MIKAYLNGIELPTLNVPFTDTTIENATDVVTADNNMYTAFGMSELKSQWTLPYEILTKDEYDFLQAIYNNQFINYEYPLFTFPHLGITDVPVRMFLSPREIWNNCGDVQNVIVTLRESVQLSGSGSS